MRDPEGSLRFVRDMGKHLLDRVRSKEEEVFINEMSWDGDDSRLNLDAECLETRRAWLNRALSFLGLSAVMDEDETVNAGGNPLLQEKSLLCENGLLHCENALLHTKEGGKEAPGYLWSPLVEIPTFQRMASRIWAGQLPGRWFAKMDAALPVAGSVKARGGIYEIVCFAMELLLKEGVVSERVLQDRFVGNGMDAEKEMSAGKERIREVLSRYTITVASTGNLGLSIGLTARKLGFRAKVYLSSDAKAWKIDKLREVGAEVVLMECDYNAVVAAARAESERDDRVYFVDDERSERLFEGYSLAALELKGQLEAQLGHDVLMASPLFVYIPCGVGGAPAGISAGLKAVFGEQVHVFVAEPLEAPSVLLELARRGGACAAGCADVRALGLTGRTVADGLAVPVASSRAVDVLGATLAGAYTLSDDKMLAYLKLLHEMENLRVEPSAAAALQGPGLMYYTKEGFDYVLGCSLMPFMDQSIHISWMTGGGLMPDVAFDEYYKEGESKATTLVDFLTSW